MKKHFLTILFILIIAVVFAHNNYQDVGCMKDCRVICKLIKEKTPSKSINNISTYQMKEIGIYEKGLFKAREENLTDDTSFVSGYKLIMEMGYQTKKGDYGMNRLKFNIIYSHQLSPYLSLGCGTGLRYYLESKVALIPLFADFRTNFSSNKKSPYLSLGVGYSFDHRHSMEPVGFLLNPTFGIRFIISSKSTIIVGLGYEIQKMEISSFEINYYAYRYDIKKIYSGAISFNIGISF